MIRDSRGKIPNFIITGGRLVHQPSGLSVEWPSTLIAQRRAHATLKGMI
jgi:hypothetical protein